MEYVGHTDITEEDLKRLAERRKRAAILEREIFGDEY